MHVEPLVEDAVLDDRVAFLGRHRARAERVPRRLDVPLDPLLHRRDVLARVLKVVPNRRWLGGGDEGGGWSAPGLGLDGPAAVLDAGREVVGTAVGFGVLKVQVLGCGGGVVGEETNGIKMINRCF